MTDEDFFSALEEKPYSLYLLYQLFIHNTDTLPDFMDRSKAIRPLEEKKLVSYNYPSKHAHYNPCNLTSEGKSFCQQYKQKLLEYFEEIPLVNKNSFDTHFHKIKTTKDAEFDQDYQKYPHLLHLGIPAIGSSRKQ